jgi:diaminopimelate decarboxylase
MSLLLMALLYVEEKWMQPYTLTASTIMMNGVDLKSVTKRYGTPLYVMNESYIRQQAQRFKASFVHEQLKTTIFYASKAFLTIAMAQLIDEEGLSLDVVSLGELHTALRANFPPSRIIFHGNNKTSLELDYALDHHVETIVIDNPYELQLLIEKVKKPQKVMLRLNPGVEAHTHEYISTTKHDSKFGLSINDVETIDVMKTMIEHPLLDFTGIHCHIGSQIFDPSSFHKEAQLLLEYMKDIKDDYGIEIKTLNLGGGFGVKYTDEDTPFDIQLYFHDLLDFIKNTCDEYQIIYPHVCIEPGRSLVGEAGVTIYTIGALKTTHSSKHFVFVDGSMADHIRTALYQAKYEARILERPLDPQDRVYSVAGKACETGDILIHESSLPTPNSGEHLVVFTTGAYHYSMASNYNRLLKPAVVFVNEHEARLIVKAQTLDDLLSSDIVL